MVQGASQNQNMRPINTRTSETFQAQNTEEAKEHESEVENSIATIRGAIDDIQDEVAGKIRVKAKDSGVSRADAEDVHQNTAQNAPPETMIETNDAKFQKQTEFNTHDHEQEMPSVASEAAALLSDEELNKLKKKGKKSSLLEKLDILGKLEGDFKLFKFKDPEKQAVVDEFFENLSRIKNLKKRLNQLEHIEREHESKKPKVN